MALLAGFHVLLMGAPASTQSRLDATVVACVLVLLAEFIRGRWLAALVDLPYLIALRVLVVVLGLWVLLLLSFLFEAV